MKKQILKIKKETEKKIAFKLLTINYKLKTGGGFTLLFASLIGALVLAVGMAILSIALKQLQLSSAGKESQKAFYSADAGIECALFLDRGGMDSDCRLGLFGTPSTTASSIEYCGGSPANPNYAECFGKKVDITVTADGTSATPPYVTSNFVLKSNNTTTDTSGGDNYGMCFNVDVKKIVDNTPGNGTDDTRTIIESRGYNTCTDSINRYERAIRVENF